MKKISLILGVALIAVALAGCTAMKQGMENLSKMAAEQEAVRQQAAQAAWESDIATGRYSGTVRVALIPVVPDNSAKTGINHEAAVAILKKNFADHRQFELLDDRETERVKRDLLPRTGSLTASKVNSSAERQADFGGVDADVILRSGLRTETFTGINKKTGKIGQGVKVICWTEYMVIGVDQVSKGSFEETNIFKNEEAVVKAAQSFHENVLNNLMVELLKARVGQSEHAGM